ncbi:hypothetical protein HOLleu_26953 [Holothuria leucospilota]|uniref:MAPEG family protein n=1 Tax=Holothuria leucospilota TaxID=206669 RepID=A0A9Q1H1Y5_HOLLE|nr:hypothetical protein HOLleu_26953 [Holothuria leucospilota]
MASDSSLEKNHKRKVHQAAVISWITVLVSDYLAVNHLPIPTPQSPILLHRIIFTTRMLVPTILPLLFGVAIIMKTRYTNYLTMGLNPVHSKGNYLLNMANRYMHNTVEQMIIFIMLQYTLSTLLSAEYLPIIPMNIFLFVISRFMYFVGYMDEEGPVNRAYGFTLTLSLNIFSTFVCLFLLIIKGPTFDL